MRQFYFMTLILSFLFLTACSYSTDFYIVNDSNYPIEVEYKVKVYPNNLVLQNKPTKINASQLKNRNGSGRYSEQLSENQYQYDKETGVVKIQVSSQEALWISSIDGYNGFSDEIAKYFYVQEISIKGTEGNIVHTNRQVLDAFSKMSETLYTLTYR